MFFATAGQQATHRGAGAGGVSVGGGFPPIAAIGRGAPPGFATRGAGECFLARGEGGGGGRGRVCDLRGRALKRILLQELTCVPPDPNDFPALGSHPSHSNMTYAAQTQPSQPSNTSNQHPQLVQQMFMQQQQMGGLVPPPPPGIVGPAASPSSQVNGMMENLRGEDFPALGAGPDGKERVGGDQDKLGES